MINSNLPGTQSTRLMGREEQVRQGIAEETPEKLAHATTRDQRLVEASNSIQSTEATVSLPTFAGYQTISQLGAGGMGVVFRAYDKNLDQIVAIKMIHLKLSADLNSLERFRSEARLLARLRHENIIRVYTADLHDGYPYFVMEYHSRGSLSKQMKEFAAPGDAARLISEVAKAVDYAHQQGVLHRDLKPANILLDEQGRAVVSDFGLAKMISVMTTPTPDAGSTAVYQPGFTTHGSTPGTPAYMAPEQYYGGALTAQVDIWSMGVMLFELISGVRPFQAILRETLAKEITTGLQDEPHRLAPAIPAKLSRIISKCMMIEPEKRYASAGELAHELDHAFARRSRRAFLIAGGLLLAGGGIVVGNQLKKQADLDQRHQQYQENCSAVRLELEQKQQVDLLGANHLPRAYSWAMGNPFMKLQNLKPDSFSQIVKDAMLLDCLDYVPKEEFTLKCQIKLDHLQSETLGRFAFFCSRELVQVAETEIHLMYGLLIDSYPDQTRKASWVILGLTNDALNAQMVSQLTTPLALAEGIEHVEISVSPNELKCKFNRHVELNASQEVIRLQAERTNIGLPSGKQVRLRDMPARRSMMLPMHQAALGLFVHRMAFEIKTLQLSVK